MGASDEEDPISEAKVNYIFMKEIGFKWHKAISCAGIQLSYFDLNRIEKRTKDEIGWWQFVLHYSVIHYNKTFY